MRASTFASLGLLAGALACGPPPGNTTGGPYQLGPDEYPPLETVGWSINHLALNVGNLTESLLFYTQLLGMRLIFQYDADEFFKVAYIGHISGGKNGTGYQTPEEMNRDKNNIQGLIEMIYVDPNATSPPVKRTTASSRQPNSFSHIGLIVPDIEVARRRLKAAGATVLKDVGVEMPPHGAIANAYGLGDMVPPGNEDFLKRVAAGIKASGSDDFLVVADPDGNVIEIQSQVPKQPAQ